MKHYVRAAIKRMIFIVALSVSIMALSAQKGSGQTYEEAKKEITEMYGTFPSFSTHFQNMHFPVPGSLSKN